jgi:hypothetical protein
MAQRPTSRRDWAEQADAKDLEDPGPERDTGYFKGQALPNDQLNELLKQLFNWTDYFDDIFQRAKEALNLFGPYIDVGANGSWSLTTDDTAEYVVSITHAGSGVARLTIAEIELETIRAVASDVLDLEDGAGNSGQGDLLLRALRPGAGNGAVQVADDAGNAGRGTTQTDSVMSGGAAASGVPAGEYVWVNADGGPDGSGRPQGTNLPLFQCLVYYDGSSWVVSSESSGIADITEVSGGRWELELEEDIAYSAAAANNAIVAHADNLFNDTGAGTTQDKEEFWVMDGEYQSGNNYSGLSVSIAAWKLDFVNQHAVVEEPPTRSGSHFSVIGFYNRS